MQSHNVCFPLQVHLAKDNRNFYDSQLSGFFNQLNIMESEYSTGLLFSHGANMSSLQKTVTRGGAMKNKIYGCYCCNIHRDALVQPNLLPCHDCIVLEPENRLLCYHQEVADEQLFEHLRVEKSEHEAAWPHLALLPLARSRIHFNKAGVNNSVLDPLHIEYRGTTISQRPQHHRLLETELSIRNTVEAGCSTAELRIQLHEILLVEASYIVLQKVLAANNLDDAMVLLEKALPCLLHLENRSSEAMIYHLLHRGMELQEGNEQLTDNLIREMERIVNQEMFGEPGSPSNWQFPLKDDRAIGDVKLANWHAR